MPTGYTEEILNGKVKTFPDFAKICMRAFGATIHMRDESFDKPYEPRIPSDYYQNNIDRIKNVLKEAKSLSDEEIVNNKVDEILKNKEYYTKKIAEIKINKIKLESILKEVEKWIPPTEEHVGFKNFMIQQITDTISGDCNTKYYDDDLFELEKIIIDPKKIRKDMIDTAKKELVRYTKSLKEELGRCNESNKWVEVLLKSI